MAHLVITIGCEYGAKGNQIGRRVAEDLGIKFYDRETVDEIIKEVGIPKDIMEKVEQGVTIAGKGAEGDTRGAFSKYADLTERAIHVQKTIIRKLADRESCVIIAKRVRVILDGVLLVDPLGAVVADDSQTVGAVLAEPVALYLVHIFE